MNVGIIGFGRITEHHFKAAEVSGAFTITAVCDSDPQVLARAPSALKKYASAHDLLADASIGAVIVATGTPTHVALTKMAIEAGKPVMVEKPVATTREEFDALESLSKRHDVPVLCLFHYASAPEVVAARALLSAHTAKRHIAMHQTFYDPYNTTFDLKDFSLMNSWIDHGINQLSIIFSLWPDAKLTLTHVALTPPSGDYYSTVGHSIEFIVENSTVSGMILLESNWSIDKNYKTTRVHISNPDHLITLEHMTESTLIDGDDSASMTFASRYPRLTNHYIHLFPEVAAQIARHESNWDISRRVHEPLFNVLERAGIQKGKS